MVTNEYSSRVWSTLIIISAIGTRDTTGHDADQTIAVLNEIFKSLYDQAEIVQEVDIDGAVFRENYNEYLVANVDSIRQVTINTVPEAQLMKDIQDELTSYLPKLIRAFDSISELFYGEMTQDDWGHFTQLTDGIQWVSQSAHGLRNHFERANNRSKLYQAIVVFETETEKLLPELEHAMEEQDYTAVGDQLKYEWPEAFKTLHEVMEAEVIV